MINKKVAFINSSNSWGGLEMNICRLAVWLQEVKVDVKVFCLANSPLHNAVVKHNVPVETIEKHRKYFDIAKSRKLSKLFKKNNIDIIFVFDNRDLSLGVVAKRLTGNNIKLIFQQQMLVVTNKKDIFHRWHHTYIDKWISPLQLLKKQVVKHTAIPESKITIIPLCIDVNSLINNTIPSIDAKQKLQINSATTMFGIVGRIDKQKGQHFVIEAIQKLRSEGYNVELLIFGEPSREQEGEDYYLYIQQLVVDLDLQNYVHFRPFSNNIGEIYPAIDIFVLASQHETYGMVTIEAMLFGKPIIATNAGGTPEILNNGEFGLLYENGNMENFLSCAHNYLDNNMLQQQYAEKAKSEANQKYSHNIETNQIVALINDL